MTYAEYRAEAMAYYQGGGKQRTDRPRQQRRAVERAEESMHTRPFSQRALWQIEACVAMGHIVFLDE